MKHEIMRICMSDAYQTIHLERMGAVAILTLSRPERMNAIDKQMLGELQDALDDVERDDELRVLVVKGAGENFSSGFDLKEQMEARPSGLTAWREILDRDFSTVTRFWHLKKPTIAAVRGYCLAGACELALICDITIAADDAIFGEPECQEISLTPRPSHWRVTSPSSILIWCRRPSRRSINVSKPWAW